MRWLALLLICLCADLGIAQTAIPSQFFGNHVGHETPANWPTVPAYAWRSWDVYTVTLQDGCTQHNITWAAIGVADNNYCWNNLDMWVSYVTGKGADIDYVIGKTPSYAGATIATPPTDLSSGDNFWKHFVSALTTRYNGQPGSHGFIKYYEIWNEPNASTFWTGTHQQLATLVADASAIIRVNSPTALIISPASQGYSSYTYLDSLLTDGIAPYVDIIGFHGYLGSRGHNINAAVPPTDGPEYTLSLINNYKVTLANHHVILPLWDTESSFGCVYAPGQSGGGSTIACSNTETSYITSQSEQASWLARKLIIAAASGIQRAYWYGWDFSPYGTQWQSTGSTIGIWPSGYAWSNLQIWLVGKTFTGPAATTDGHIFTVPLLNSAGYAQKIVWNNSASCTISTPCPYIPGTSFQFWQVLSTTATADTPTLILANNINITSDMPILLTAGSQVSHGQTGRVGHTGKFGKK